LLDKYRDTLVLEPLLSTSDAAFSKVNVETSTTYEKEKNDIAGPFHLGVTISETVDEDKETQIVYYATETILDEGLNEQVSGGNAELFMNSLTWMSKGDDSSSISIASKSLQMSPLTLNQSDISLWTIVTLILIPGAFIICGFVIWLRRRKK
jgi:ABC-2 type transport system permease protein